MRKILYIIAFVMAAVGAVCCGHNANDAANDAADITDATAAADIDEADAIDPLSTIGAYDIDVVDDSDAAAAVAAESRPKGEPDFEYIFQEQPNPYDNYQPMPDDGCVKLRVNGVGGPLAKVFNDSNYVHYEVAERLGIDPIENCQDIWRAKRPLVKIVSCPEYLVDTLTHSYPFLVPEAAQLLSDLGRRFNDTLAARGGGAYRIKVTSVLRTPMTVKKLRRINRNSVDSSVHKFATTFDVSYVRFAYDGPTSCSRTQEDLKNLLAEILFTLREEGRCFVKYERNQGCFHITARN